MSGINGHHVAGQQSVGQPGRGRFGSRGSLEEAPFGRIVAIESGEDLGENLCDELEGQKERVVRLVNQAGERFQPVIQEEHGSAEQKAEGPAADRQLHPATVGPGRSSQRIEQLSRRDGGTSRRIGPYHEARLSARSRNDQSFRGAWRRDRREQRWWAESRRPAG